jgi:N6-adenosine-specific RNA methylase IME4
MGKLRQYRDAEERYRKAMREKKIDPERKWMFACLPPIFGDNKYTVIYADPPWRYRNFNKPNSPRGARKEYFTMRRSYIEAFHVHQIAAPDSALFMWATFPLLPEALKVMEVWGFKYVTCAFTWVKTNPKSGGYSMGMGSWTRANSEICLLGTRGNPRRVSPNVHSVVESPVGKHSAKPDEVAHRIVQLMGDVPRIELFARSKRSGWDVWGHEAQDIKKTR